MSDDGDQRRMVAKLKDAKYRKAFIEVLGNDPDGGLIAWELLAGVLEGKPVPSRLLRAAVPNMPELTKRLRELSGSDDPPPAA